MSRVINRINRELLATGGKLLYLSLCYNLSRARASNDRSRRCRLAASFPTSPSFSRSLKSLFLPRWYSGGRWQWSSTVIRADGACFTRFCTRRQLRYLGNALYRSILAFRDINKSATRATGNSGRICCCCLALTCDIRCNDNVHNIDCRKREKISFDCNRNGTIILIIQASFIITSLYILFFFFNICLYSTYCMLNF